MRLVEGGGSPRSFGRVDGGVEVKPTPHRMLRPLGSIKAVQPAVGRVGLEISRLTREISGMGVGRRPGRQVRRLQDLSICGRASQMEPIIGDVLRRHHVGVYVLAEATRPRTWPCTLILRPMLILVAVVAVASSTTETTSHGGGRAYMRVLAVVNGPNPGA